MNRQQAIEAIKQGTHVLDVERHSEEARRFVNDELVDVIYYQGKRYYGIDAEGVLIFLNPSEINNRPIIKLSDILSEVWTEVPTNFRPPTDDEINSLSDSTKETAISETKDMREYDEKLLNEFGGWIWKETTTSLSRNIIKEFIEHRYQNESILKQIAEKENNSLNEKISDFYLAFLGSHDQNDIDNFKSMIYEIVMEKEQRLKNLKSS